MKKSLQAKEYIELLERQIKSLECNAKIGYWELDLSTQEVFWSPVIYDIFGIDKSIKPNFDFALSYFNESEREQLAAALDMCVKSKKSFEVDLKFVDANKNIKWTRTFGSALENDSGEVISLYGSFQDLTQDKMKEYELNLILQSAKVGVFKFDIVHNHLTWDHGMFDLYEVDQNDFSSVYEEWSDALHPDNKEEVQQMFNDFLDGKREDFDFTFKIQTKNGTVKYLAVVAFIEKNALGKPVLMYGVNIDRTQEVLSQQELDEQRKASLIQAKLASIGELAAGVGHEINNPLSIAFGYIDQLLKNDQLAENSAIKKIYESLSRIERIVSGLRSFSRIENDTEDFDLVASVEESLNLINDIYTKQGVEIYFNVDNNSKFYIHGNKGEFQQVLMNLISNAKDATVNQDQRIVEIKLENSTSHCILSVIDNGVGISEDSLHKIFDSFFTTKKKGKGTGIGLALTNSIVKKMGAQIKVESEPSSGSCFKVFFPKVVNPQLTDADEDSPEIDKQAKQKMLIVLVDDEADLLELLEFQIKDLGHETLAFTNPVKALDYITRNRVDIVISDVKMPEISGTELVRKVREDLNIHQPKFLLVTGGVTHDFEDGSLVNNQINGYLYKPYRFEELVKKLEEMG